MLKEALQYIIGLGNSEIRSIGNQNFATQPIHLVKEATASALVVRNLTGLVDYLTTNYDKNEPVLVQVDSPTEVNVYSTFNRDMNRNHLLQSSALLPRIPFGSWNDVEEFNILLQSNFVNNTDRGILLSVIGNITENDVRTVGDNGISQQVTAKSGIATVDNVVVPNPVLLKPYRTFVEVTQPESQFVFRMKSGNNGPMAALYEADGGAWKIQAIHTIRDYLSENLKEQIEAKQVTIIA